MSRGKIVYLSISSFMAQSFCQPLGHIVLNETEQVGEIISDKLGPASHHKPSLLWVDSEQTSRSAQVSSRVYTKRR